MNGSRIKSRRLQLGLSADYVAQKIGRNRATVYRYESDYIDSLPYLVVGKLAEVLECSPAYLMGFSDDINEKAATENSDGAPDRTSLLVKMFDQLSPEGQEAVLQALVDQLKAGK